MADDIHAPAVAHYGPAETDHGAALASVAMRHIEIESSHGVEGRASTSFPPDAGAAFTGLFCTSPGPDVAELLEHPPRSLGDFEPPTPHYPRRPWGYVSADPVDRAAWHRTDAAADRWLSKLVVRVGRHRRAPVIDYERLEEYTQQLLLATDYERACREQDELDRCIGLATQLDAVDDIAAYVYGVVRVVPAPDDAETAGELGGVYRTVYGNRQRLVLATVDGGRSEPGWRGSSHPSTPAPSTRGTPSPHLRSHGEEEQVMADDVDMRAVAHRGLAKAVHGAALAWVAAPRSAVDAQHCRRDLPGLHVAVVLLGGPSS